jgi:hypothetical protein
MRDNIAGNISANALDKSNSANRRLAGKQFEKCAWNLVKFL